MITCTFEKGFKAALRHVVVRAIADNGAGILLVKRAGDIIESGKWAMPGGYLDRDETASQGAIRELFEETGWDGSVLALFAINTKPDRPAEDRQNVAFDFLVKPTVLKGKPDSESSDVKFFPYDGLPDESEFAFDHAQTIGIYLSYKKNPFALPIQTFL